MTFRRTANEIAARTSRNQPCPCGSGRRYKHCCGAWPKTTAAAGSFGRAPQMNQADFEPIRSLRQAGNFHKAERLAREYVATTPTDPAGQTELGLVLLWANRVAEADASLGQAVRLAPGSAGNHYNLALALERLGRDRDAIAALRQTIVTDANHPAALERLGNLLVKYGRPNEATECF